MCHAAWFRDLENNLKNLVAGTHNETPLTCPKRLSDTRRHTPAPIPVACRNGHRGRERRRVTKLLPLSFLREPSAPAVPFVH